MDVVRSQSDPSQYGALIHSNSNEDLERHKASGVYEQLVDSSRHRWLDEAKPIHEQVLDVLDI